MNSLNEQFSRIYDQYIEKIYRFVYLKVNSQEIAEDISSRVFLKCWETYRDDQSKIKNISAFLYQISRNMVVDHYREKGKARIVSPEYSPQIADPRTNLYEKAVLNADIEVIKSALQSISKDYQDVIIWHYLEDMSAEQISEIINKPQGTVRVMIHRGLQSLKNVLNQEV
jgi:RNA polymerase sigma-70 factor, ECF subfamily